MPRPSPQAAPDLPEDLAGHIADTLQETDELPRSQIRKVLHALGQEDTLALLEEAERIEAAGGLLVPDGSRRRTFGGVFFHLARQKLSRAQRFRIFSPAQPKEPDEGRSPAAPPPPKASPTAAASKGRGRVVEVTVIRRAPRSVAETAPAETAVPAETATAAVPTPSAPAPTQTAPTPSAPIRRTVRRIAAVVPRPVEAAPEKVVTEKASPPKSAAAPAKAAKSEKVVSASAPKGAALPEETATAPASAPSSDVLNKKDFVLRFPATTPVAEVIEAARKQGLTLSASYVYNLRRGQAPAAATPRPGAQAPSRRPSSDKGPAKTPAKALARTPAKGGTQASRPSSKTRAKGPPRELDTSLRSAIEEELSRLTPSERERVLAALLAEKRRR